MTGESAVRKARSRWLDPETTRWMISPQFELELKILRCTPFNAVRSGRTPDENPDPHLKIWENDTGRPIQFKRAGKGKIKLKKKEEEI